MLEIPRRISLSTQVAAAIRKGIEDGVWEEFLPGERRLCDLFQVSRPTVRAALHTLAKDGWFEIAQGRRNRLRGAVRRDRPAPKRGVGIIIHEPFAQLGATLSQGLSEMRLQLAEQGFSTEVYVCPPHGTRAQRRGLEAFIRQNRVFCCVLVSASRTVQKLVFRALDPGPRSGFLPSSGQAALGSMSTTAPSAGMPRGFSSARATGISPW